MSATPLVYVLLRGRIGNQLFILAAAKQLRRRLGPRATLVIDDSEVLGQQWTNSLADYDLPDVEFVHARAEVGRRGLGLQYLFLRVFGRVASGLGFQSRFRFEKFWRPFLGLFGIVACENGYLPFSVSKGKKYLLSGFFQSELYFPDLVNEMRSLVLLENVVASSGYPNLEKIQDSNTVCISIKIEHNVGNTIYSVCDRSYWERAIDYILKNVHSPVLFLCSDDVEYVRKNLIDFDKYDVVCQDRSYSHHISLAVMARCKHFIIGNTTFGWWAQYAATNPKKIVVAPSRWMAVDMPIHLYQPHWHLIDV